MRSLTRLRSLFAVLAVASSLLVLAGPAAGQATTSDPYGPTVPPTEPPGDPSCTVDDTQVEAGATVNGTIVGLEAGAEVDLTLLGQVLATVVADADGEATFSIVVPEIAGISVLVAVGATFNVDCGELDPGEVLGENEERPAAEVPGGSDVSGGGASGDGGGAANDGSGGGLARTGATLLPLVVLALIALAVGAYLRRRSRERRLAV